MRRADNFENPVDNRPFYWLYTMRGAMSDRSFPQDAQRSLYNSPGGLGVQQPSGWFNLIFPLVLFLVGAIAAAAVYQATLFGNAWKAYVPTVFCIVLAVFLSLLPPMICVVQNTTRKRQLDRLSALSQFAVSKTMYYRTARTSVDNDQTGAVNADFRPPLFVYFFIVLFGFVAILLGYSFQNTFVVPNFILSGLHTVDESGFVPYQTGTFCVAATAFFAAYVYSLGRLLDRVNNNDLYPISLYYYAVRAVIACVSAATMRHTANVFGVESSPILLLVAFGIGFAPDLFIIAMTRRAFQAIKVWGNREDPPSRTRPPSLPLLMIDDLSRDKIDRLSELGIDNAQILARQNPFLLLTRLPYDLGLIVDWIAQAQLYVLVKDEKMEALRRVFIRDVCDLYNCLQPNTTRTGVYAALGINAEEAGSLLQQLNQDPSFIRLKEVRCEMASPGSGVPT